MSTIMRIYARWSSIHCQRRNLREYIHASVNLGYAIPGTGALHSRIVQ
jgi:hypothetical protein